MVVILDNVRIIRSIAFTMRDDIHKSAPVNAKWRRYLGRCVREADRGDRADRAAVDAILDDFRKEIPEELHRAIIEKCEHGQRDFFSQEIDSIRERFLEAGVLGQSLLLKLNEAELSGPISKPIYEVCLKKSIEERFDARTRAMKAHVLRDGGAGSR